MDLTHEAIKIAINSVFVKGSYFYNEYIVEQLKSEKSFEILSEIIEKSGKTVSEALLVLLAAIRYHYRDVHILAKIEADNSFQKILLNHHQELIEISVPGKVQGNTPDRALPVLEILSKKMNQENICLIELGASFGLIGSCLLFPEILLENGTKYLVENQKLPESIKKIDTYLGIDINPPSQDWLLSCFSRIEDAVRIQNYIKEIPSTSDFRLIKASAVGFSNLDEVNDLLGKNKKIVVLTSFMLYQFDHQLRKQLTDEILDFCKQNNSDWIAQEVDITDFSKPVYYIDYNGERIISLQDDKCSNWQWI